MKQLNLLVASWLIRFRIIRDMIEEVYVYFSGVLLERVRMVEDW